MNRLNVRDLVINVRETIGDNLILTEIHDAYEYQNGVRTDKVIGQAYTVLLPQRGYAALTVKVPGARKLDVDLGAGNMIRVRFQGLVIKPYAISGRTGVSAKADSIVIVSGNAKAGTA